jgi:hypothetical protein
VAPTPLPPVMSAVSVLAPAAWLLLSNLGAASAQAAAQIGGRPPTSGTASSGGRTFVGLIRTFVGLIAFRGLERARGLIW